MTQEERDRITTQEEAMKTARSMGEELKILFAEFAVSAQPLMDLLKAVVGTLSTVMQWLGKIDNGFAQIAVVAAAYFGMKIAKEKLINRILGERIGITQRLTAANRQNAAAQAPVQGARNPTVPTTAASSGGRFAVGSRMNMGTSLAAGMIGAQIKDGEGGWRDRAGGALQGAALGMTLGGPWGALAGGIGGALGLFADGTDSTPRGPAIVGEEGPELLVPPPGSAVVNNSSMTALANGAGVGNNTAVVAAVQALGSKLDSVVASLNASGDFVMQVDDREFGRVINKHLGEPGYQKIDLRTA
jgi:hypothetical protein